MVAAALGHVHVVRALIGLGAAVDAADSVRGVGFGMEHGVCLFVCGLRTLHARPPPFQSGTTALMGAADVGKERTIQLLVEKGAALGATDKARTAAQVYMGGGEGGGEGGKVLADVM